MTAVNMTTRPPSGLAMFWSRARRNKATAIGATLVLVMIASAILAPSDMYAADRFWGDRSAHAYAWRTQLNHGASLAFGSDAPVESPNPFLGLHAAVTRRRADGSPSAEGWYPEQKLTLAEALSAYTVGAAYAANRL